MQLLLTLMIPEMWIAKFHQCFFYSDGISDHECLSLSKEGVRKGHSNTPIVTDSQ